MIRVAAYQVTPQTTFDARKEQIHNALQKADCEKIDFVCFPEGFLTGYYTQESLARKSSLEVHESVFKDFLSEIRSYLATIIIGFNEREDDSIFDSAAVIEKGNLLGIQRKHYLYHDYFTSDDQFSVFHNKGITFGVVIWIPTILNLLGSWPFRELRSYFRLCAIKYRSIILLLNALPTIASLLHVRMKIVVG